MKTLIASYDKSFG